MKINFAKWKPYIFLAILLLSLIPLIWLGRYNYPTGDDYYYGAETHLVWQQTGSITQTLAAACAAEYEDRLLLLNDPEVTDVVLTPFTHQPALIYSGDLPGDPEDPTSRKVAQYFQKTSLYVNYDNN